MKATKAQAHYRDRPNGPDECVRCTMFQRPNACSAVEGEISPAGWCEYFKARARAAIAAMMR